jgi:hypothetical protein
MSFSGDDVAEWSVAMANLRHNTTAADCERRAGQAVANLWSAYGYQAPPEVDQMLLSAIEAGYQAALSDVRAGEWDAEIVVWREECFTRAGE